VCIVLDKRKLTYFWQLVNGTDFHWLPSRPSDLEACNAAHQNEIYDLP